MIKEAELRQHDLEQQAQADVRGALLDLAGAREQLDAARERLRFAAQEVSQAKDRFNAGVAGNADVVNASLALTSSRTLVNDAETAYQLARVSLAEAAASSGFADQSHFGRVFRRVAGMSPGSYRQSLG